ncbi:hypothetical protein [Pseudomonas sp. PGPR81]|uniref:hypothetical protein n=1 Tax=Pseudomonas sp. PGPR81 TaxID=2913477 RepID=UPI001EDA805C|nr:hypothetical protein [Pseudomonas sp. PGPR81]
MSWFVVMAMCGQLAGEAKPDCSPYRTFRKLEFTDEQACIVVANERRTRLEQALKDKAAHLGKKLEKMVVYSECNTASETVKLLEDNLPTST